jgi:hypothetical protein
VCPLPVVVSSLLPLTTEVCPPLSDPHVLHTPLELRNLCVTRFEPSWVTCAMRVSRAGLELSPFCSVSECPSERARWSTLEWRRQLRIDPDEF